MRCRFQTIAVTISLIAAPARLPLWALFDGEVDTLTVELVDGGGAGGLGGCARVFLYRASVHFAEELYLSCLVRFLGVDFLELEKLLILFQGGAGTRGLQLRLTILGRDRKI